MEWLPIVTVVVVGLLVGVELSVSFVINPIVDRLPGNAGLLARADGGRMLGRAMPPWYIGSTALVAGTALTTPGGAAPAWVAVALMLGSVALSLALLVPLNNQGKSWTPETAPADWREQIGRWDRWHLVRLALIVAAFVLVTVAATR